MFSGCTSNSRTDGDLRFHGGNVVDVKRVNLAIPGHAVTGFEKLMLSVDFFSMLLKIRPRSFGFVDCRSFHCNKK